MLVCSGEKLCFPTRRGIKAWNWQLIQWNGSVQERKLHPFVGAGGKLLSVNHRNRQKMSVGLIVLNKMWGSVTQGRPVCLAQLSWLWWSCLQLIRSWWIWSSFCCGTSGELLRAAACCYHPLPCCVSSVALWVWPWQLGFTEPSGCRHWAGHVQG